MSSFCFAKRVRLIFCLFVQKGNRSTRFCSVQTGAHVGPQIPVQHAGPRRAHNLKESCFGKSLGYFPTPPPSAPRSKNVQNGQFCTEEISIASGGKETICITVFTPETNWNSSRIEWMNCHTFQWQFVYLIRDANSSPVWMGLSVPGPLQTYSSRVLLVYMSPPPGPTGFPLDDRLWPVRSDMKHGVLCNSAWWRCDSPLVYWENAWADC